MTDNVVQLIPNIDCAPGCEAKVAKLTTAQLKFMWSDQTMLDNGMMRFEHLWEDIHAEMNRRGEGGFVAV